MYNVKNYKEFACFDYESEEHEIYELGDVVVDRFGDVGIIIQTFADGCVRCDSNGMESMCCIKPALSHDIHSKRKELIYLYEKR